MLLKSALLNIIFVTYAAAQSFPLGPFPPNGNRPSINSEKAAENGYEIERHTTRCDRRSDSDSGTESDRDGRDGRDGRDRHHHSSHCSSSRHSSSHCRTSTSHCRTSTSHCHSTTSCHSTTHCKPTRSECCSTKTVTTTIDNKCCYLLIHPCPTNSAVTVTSTVSVLPTQASVLPTQAVLAPVCTPCTDYVTTTTMPNLACTTMIFCDVAGQSENCIAKNEQDIEAIVSRAARDGSQVFVNGQLVVFRSGSSSASVSASSGSTVLTVTGQQANDASAAVVGSGLVGLFGAIAGFLLFGI